MSDRTGSQIDHLNLAVPDLARSVRFYTPVLATLGITTVLAIPARPDLPAMHGFGWAERKPFFWLIDGGTVGSNMHLAFTAADRDEVRAFHESALAAGAEELHQPGVWEEYHPDYYGGFVRDPDGVNLEAVCHEAGSAETYGPRRGCRVG